MMPPPDLTILLNGPLNGSMSIISPPVLVEHISVGSVILGKTWHTLVKVEKGKVGLGSTKRI